MVLVRAVRVVPALPEHGVQHADGRPPEHQLDVVPGRPGSIGRGHGLRLRVAAVLGVVPARVAQIDTTDEGDVAGGVVRMPEDDELLVVAAHPPHPLVEDHLPAAVLDRAVERAVLLLGERHPGRVGAPHEAADLHAPSCSRR